MAMALRARLISLLMLLVLASLGQASAAPKREFRGAWIQTIYQGYDRRSTD